MNYWNIAKFLKMSIFLITLGRYRQEVPLWFGSLLPTGILSLLHTFFELADHLSSKMMSKATRIVLHVL